MIRVLHTIDTTGTGGAETVFVSLATGLDPQRFMSIPAIASTGWVCDMLRKNGIEPLFIHSEGGFNFQYLLELIKIIREHNIDIVQSHLLGSNLYCSLAGLICRVPVISTFHGFVDAKLEDQLIAVKSRLINFGSKMIVFVSDGLREHFIKEYNISPQKSVTIYNGVDTSVFRPQKDNNIRREFGLGPENILIGAVGNMRPAKGHEYFLKAARLVHDRYPESRFVIAGERSGVVYENLLELRNDLNMESYFYFIGFHDDVAKVLNNFDVYVLPSVSEGFSISTVEAMACCIPVIVTRSGGPEEIVIDGENGIMVESKDHIGIAEAIFKIIRSQKLKDNIVNSSFKKVYDNFTILKMINKYKNIYLNILD